MKDRCVIISGGEYFAITDILDGDFVIACDRGYEYAKNSHVVPDLVVGDFDSYSGTVEAGTAVERYQSEKDDTDTMIAVRYAIEHGYKEITMLCALGGRLDHTYANLQAAAYAAQNGLRVKIYDDRTIIYTVKGGTLRLPKRDGYSVSVFSFTDRCNYVTVQGLKYPLNEASLANVFPIGVSNEWKDDHAEVSVGEGILFVILSKLER